MKKWYWYAIGYVIGSWVNGAEFLVPIMVMGITLAIIAVARWIVGEESE